MKTFVVDACALIAYLFDEEGSDFFSANHDIGVTYYK